MRELIFWEAFIAGLCLGFFSWLTKLNLPHDIIIFGLPCFIVVTPIFCIATLYRKKNAITQCISIATISASIGFCLAFMFIEAYSTTLTLLSVPFLLISVVATCFSANKINISKMKSLGLAMTELTLIFTVILHSAI